VQRICIVKYAGVIAPHVMEAFNRAFRSLGVETHVLDLVEMGEAPSRAVELLKEVQARRPEAAISYGHTGLIPLKDGWFFRVIGVPLVILHYDCPFFVMNDAFLAEFRAHPDAYRHFVWDGYFLDALRAKGIENVHPIMLATDPEVFRPPGDAARTPSPGYDVAFVGGVGDVGEMRQERLGKLPADANAFIERVIAAKINRPSVPALELWGEIAREFPQFPVNWDAGATANLYFHVHREGSPLMRRVLLDLIRSASPDVFGAEWENPNIRFHPKLDYFTELPRLYAQARISLNVTSMQLERSVNNRVFDVGAAGGFLLTDYREDLERIFPHHRHLVYHSAAELDGRIAHFLAHEEERGALAQESQKCVLAGHTWKHRAQYIMEVLAGSKSEIRNPKEIRMGGKSE
jgi:spore maturation protein CgeB